MTYRAEVVGSLLRPTYLAKAREQLAAGQLNAAEFKAIEDRSKAFAQQAVKIWKV